MNPSKRENIYVFGYDLVDLGVSPTTMLKFVRFCSANSIGTAQKKSREWVMLHNSNFLKYKQRKVISEQWCTEFKNIEQVLKWEDAII